LLCDFTSKFMIKRKLINALLAFFIATTIVQTGFAQAGSLDTTFRVSGIVTTSFADRSYATAVEVTNDGKTYVVGPLRNPSHVFDILVIRYLSNGLLDTSFGGTGYVITNLGEYSTAYSLAVQNDGKILVVGTVSRDNAIVLRYNPNGTLDYTFGIGGGTRIDTGSYTVAKSVLVAPDGNIYVGGDMFIGSTTGIFVAKLNANGRFDPYFGLGGYIATAIERYSTVGKIAIQPDGKIVVTGDAFIGSIARMFVARYGIFGVLDSTFDGDGIAIYNNAKLSKGNDIKVQNDGKIVISGNIYNGIGTYLSVFRYNTDGSLDSTFGTGGASSFPIDKTGNTASLEIQSDGNIVVAGSDTIATVRDFLIVRFLANGSLDTSFGIDGYRWLDLGGAEVAWDVAINRVSRKITVVGNGSYVAITARFHGF
jgi:uncharacterized delta-60 repeat protein